MDNTTTQQNSQLEPNEAAASLAFATKLQEQMMGADTQQTADQNAQTPQEQAKNQPQDGQSEDPKKEGTEAKIELNMTDKLEEIRKEIKADMQREIDGLKEQITSALAEDNNEPNETTKNS